MGKTKKYTLFKAIYIYIYIYILYILYILYIERLVQMSKAYNIFGKL